MLIFEKRCKKQARERDFTINFWGRISRFLTESSELILVAVQCFGISYPSILGVEVHGSNVLCP